MLVIMVTNCYILVDLDIPVHSGILNKEHVCLVNSAEQQHVSVQAHTLSAVPVHMSTTGKLYKMGRQAIK